MRLRSLLCACFLALSMSAGAQAPAAQAPVTQAPVAQTTVSIAPDAASKEDVKKLFDVMASREQMAKMMQQVFTQMRSLNRDEIKKQHPDITQEEMASMDRQSEEVMKNFPLDQMLSDMIPVYQKHFTKSEIDALIAFY